MNTLYDLDKIRLSKDGKSDWEFIIQISKFFLGKDANLQFLRLIVQFDPVEEH